MSQRRYKAGVCRSQQSLLPPSVEDYVGEANPVRAIDAYIESLDLSAQGFSKAAGDRTAGQPAYAPQALLKLYLYGYLNRVRSSRRLAREAQRNVEVMWLLGGLTPGYKTVSDFRKENGQALKEVNRDFVLLCKELDLFSGELVGLDGSFFRGNASKGSIVTEKQLKRQMKELEAKIASYLEELAANDKADEEGSVGDLVTEEHLSEKLAALQAKQAAKQSLLEELQAQGERQCSQTDPDARRLSKGRKQVAGYNVQHSVDSQHKLIVHHEVTNAGNDVEQLLPMCQASKGILGVERLTALADSGYYNLEQIRASIAIGVTPYVPAPNKTQKETAQGRYCRERFHYDKQANHYRCPAGQVLTPVGKRRQQRGRWMQRYQSQPRQCAGCPLKRACLPKQTGYRQLLRWEHEEVAQAHHARMKGSREQMRKRSSLVEHPFGTLKRWCGGEHFLVRGFEKVRGEMSLLVLCYNFKRVLNIIGIEAFKRYCACRAKVSQPGADFAAA